MQSYYPASSDDAHRHAQVPRVAERHKTFELTTLTGPSGTARAHILNLSTSGAQLHVAEPPERGSSVTVDIGGGAVRAHVVWISGGRFGVAFKSELSVGAIDRVLAPHRHGAFRARS